MEAAGLAVGIAGLFSACLDAIEILDSYKHFETDIGSFSAQFDADKLLFRKWGTAVGIDQGCLAEEHHAYLDDPDTALVVEAILASIRDLELNASRIPPGPMPKAGAGQEPRHGLSSASLPRQQKKKDGPSRKQKMAWSVRHKARYMSQVVQFGTLVERLHALVPADKAPGKASTWASPHPELLEHGDGRGG